MRNDKNTEATPVKELRDELAGGEGALSRWSRRKQEALKDTPPDLPATTVADESEPEQPVLTDVDMPPVEELSEDSDYSGFLSPGVSEELRALALRKLFRSAKFNIRDGLDDYDDDFRAVTLLKDALLANATDKINKETEQAPDDEENESTQSKQESVAQSDEQDNTEDIVADKDGESDNELDDENNDKTGNDGESGAV